MSCSIFANRGSGWSYGKFFLGILKHLDNTGAGANEHAIHVSALKLAGLNCSFHILFVEHTVIGGSRPP
jgi:hypothetical protein